MNTKVEIFVVCITTISVFVILYQQFAQPTGSTLIAIYIFDLLVVIILSADFYHRMKESKQGIKFVIKHCYEIPAMIPIFIFGLLESQSIFNVALRSIRLIRLFRLINLLSRTSYILGHTNNRIIFTVVFSILAVSMGAVGMYIVEGNVKGTKISNISDAFWWAIVTVTTVGYGDIYPITTEGKVIAVLLMIVGIAILGILISTLGAGLIESRLKPKPKLGEDTKNKIKEGIDILELLQKDDVNSLINMITNLHTELNKPRYESQSSCVNCGHINPKMSLYCNQCGYSILNKE
jgi:voltage-gated potassium channel